MEPSDLATRAFAVSVNRALALYASVAIVAGYVVGYQGLAHLNTSWLVVVAASLVGCTVATVLTVALPRWSPLAHVLFSACAFAALLTWPLAWEGATLAGTPFVWPLVGVAVLALTWAGRETWVSLVVSSSAALAWGFLRLGESGGAVGVLAATGESLVVLAAGVGWSLALSIGQRAAEQLDASTGRASAVAEQTAIRASVQRERRALDAFVHDRVMTTLAAAGRETMSRDRIAATAAGARDALASYDSTDSSVEHVTASEAVELVANLVGDASSSASVEVTCSPGVEIPRRVGYALARAAQEGVRNAVRHASASNIAVTGTITQADSAVHVQLTVADDGIGYDATEIPDRRLGVRLSLQDRMRNVGGVAFVSSTPGLGTVVRLAWSGDVCAAAPDLPPEAAPGAFADQVDVEGLVWIGRIQGAMTVFIGLVLATVGGHVAEWAILALLAVAGVIAYGARVYERLRVGETVAIALLLAVAAAARGATGTGWSASETLFVVIILFALPARGAAAGAWLTLGAMSATGVVAAVFAATSVVPYVVSLAAPAVAVVLGDLLLRWLGHVEARVERAQAAFEEATAKAAQLFSSLLRRDVWMAGVRASVEPILTRLADPAVPLTAEERERCLRLEAQLRDSITARNLSSPRVARAVDSARERGVSVTLIDNRQGTLPAAARDAALGRLASAADAAVGGRIVARVAPAGYQDLVTIMTDGVDGHTLISIDETGKVTQT
jgi:signal transduction histidine kinase